MILKRISLKAVPLALAGAVTLSACQTTSPMNENPPSGQFTGSQLGTVVGAVAGGLLGGQIGEGGGKTTAAVAGALLGAWVGNNIGAQMTASDQAHYKQAAQTATTAPVGETIVWYNPETSHQGSITPTREGQTTDGRYCREYQQKVMIGGKEETAYGQACRQPDGSWEIVN